MFFSASNLAWMLFPPEVHDDLWAGYGQISA